MAIWNTQKNEYWDRINILNEELTLRDSVIYLQDIKVDKMALIQLSYKQIIVEKNDLKMLCEAEKKDYITEIKRQKRLSWMIGGLGALATGFSTYLFIKK